METSRIGRFDDIVRSERYFTATLLPAMLLHDEMLGLRAFLALIEKRALLPDGQPTERNRCGKRTRRPNRQIPCYLGSVEIITEFHIARDLMFADMLTPAVPISPEDLTTEREKRDAPDLVIVLDDELVVCEGKFFDDYSSASLDAQLRSQRRQVRQLLAHRASLQAYRHVAILPVEVNPPPDCDVVITWADIAALAADVLGCKHYVTARLRAAVEHWKSIHCPDPCVNFDGALRGLESMLAKCREDGNTIHVGFSGGIQALLAQPLADLERRRWRWRNPLTNRGVTIRNNWILDTQFVKLIEHRRSQDPGTIQVREDAACNCLCTRQ